MSETLLGRYRLEASLGRGGAAEVFRARDLELDRVVAVKVLTGDGPMADAARMREEARALARLDHLHILDILAIEEDAARLFLVLELAEGGSLATRLASQGPLPEAEARQVVAQLLDALAAAHGAGVVHRDVKPANVLLVDGEVKLADFGLAKHSESKLRTASGVLLGTPEYMAPEVFRGEVVTAAADVYAAGCLAYELVTGRPLYAGAISSLVRQKLADVPRPDLAPRGLRRWLVSLLDPDPTRRPSAAAAARALVTAGAPGGPTVALSAAPVADRTQVSGTRRPRGATESTPRRILWPLLLSPLVLLLGAAWWWSRLPAASSPGLAGAVPGPPPGAGAEGEARELATRWERHLGGRDWEGALRNACRAMVGVSRMTLGETRAYPQELADLRKQPRTPAAVLEAERGLIRDLRIEDAWDRDRSRVLRLLADRGATLEARQRLLEALAPLAHADALLRAAGREAHFDAGAILEAHAPRGLVTWPGELPPAPLLQGALSPGERRLVFAWERAGDRRFPRVDPRGIEASLPEGLILQRHAQITGGDFDPERHLGVYRRVSLGPEAVRAAWLEVDLRVTNFFATNVLRLRVNQFRTFHHGGPEMDGLGHWRFQDPTWWRLRVRVPGDALRVGDNVLEVTASPLPGLGRWAGFWLERVEVTLVPA